MVERATQFLKVKLMDWAEGWLLNLRQEYRAVARLLNEQELSSLRGYFSAELLAKVRVACVERIPNPSFFANLPQLGLPVPWDFSSDTGLSVVDVVMLSQPLVPEERQREALFHQCVHVQQFQTLGVSRMIKRYVDGLFENGFNFRALPMERQAESLRSRFLEESAMFSVEQEVEQALLKGAI